MSEEIKDPRSLSNLRARRYPGQIGMVGRLLCAIAPLAAMIACQAEAKETDTGKGAGKGAGGSAPVPVLAETAHTQSIPFTLSATGTGEAFTTIDIKSQVTAQLLEAHFHEGDFVKKDDVLFTLDARPFEALLAEAKANLERDEASVENARLQLKRTVELRASNSVSQAVEEQARTDAQTREAQVLASKASADYAQLQTDYCTIKSPIGGRTGALQTHPGAIVKANDTLSLVTINQIEPIYVTFKVPEQHLFFIRQRLHEKKELPTSATIPGTDTPVRGEVVFVDNQVDSRTGTVLLKASFPNEDHALWPGQFVHVRLTLEEQANRLVIPSQAVQASQNGTYVYRIKDDKSVEMKFVKVERTQDGFALIQEGLQSGDQVVTDGQMRLAPGSKVEIKPSLDGTKAGS